MKTYKTLVSELFEASKPTTEKKDKIVVGEKKKKKVVDDRPKGVLGVLGSVAAGAVAAAHRHLIHPAHAKYGYQPIKDYMKGQGSKRKVYIETDD
jgi:hypothetical protein